MKSSRFVRSALAGAVLLGAGSVAQAATVTFTNINDPTPGANFDSATSLAAGNTLNIGLLNFAASAPGLFGSVAVATDTINFLITAPTGFKVTKVTYNESGTFTNGANATTVDTGSWSVNGVGGVLGTEVHTAGATGTSGTWSLGTFTNPNSSTALVTITNTLVAIAGPTNANIAKTLASVSVDLAPVPLPPAAWMLGSALVALVTVGRRKGAV